MRAPRAEALRWLRQAENDLGYPNGLPGAVPYEVYTSAQAGEAVATCAEIVRIAHTRLPPEDADGAAPPS